MPRESDKPGRKLKAENVLDFGQHVLVHLVRQVSDGQKQILDLRVGRVAAEDDVSRSGSHVLLIDSSVLVINPVHRALHLQDNIAVYFPTGADPLRTVPSLWLVPCLHLVGQEADVVSLQGGEGDGAECSDL